MTCLDFLQIGAVFMPVRKVNYTIEDAHIGSSLEQDRLIMDIWTNGSYTPQDALSNAAGILMSLFEPLKDIDCRPEPKIRKTNKLIHNILRENFVAFGNEVQVKIIFLNVKM